MSRNGGGPREIAVPMSVFDALRSELEAAAGTLQTVRALHQAGYEAGTAAAPILHLAAGGSSLGLSRDGFWSHLSGHFSKRGWGSLTHEAIHPGVGLIETRDWAEANVEEVSADASCSFSAGYLSGLLTELAGGPIAVLEVSCLGRGDDSCDFAFGSEAAIHDLYGHLLEGADLQTALSSL